MSDLQLFCPRCDRQRTRQEKYLLEHTGPLRTVVHGLEDGQPLVMHLAVQTLLCRKCLTTYYASIDE